MLESEGFNDTLVPFLVVLGLLVKLLFEAGNPRQVLLLLEEYSVTLKVGIFDSLLALVSQLLNCLFFLFVEGDALLLILKQGHQVIVLLGTGLKLRADRP